MANRGCDGQGATSQGHDLSARGLLRGQEGVKRLKANLSCPAVAVCRSGPEALMLTQKLPGSDGAVLAFSFGVSFTSVSISNRPHSLKTF